METANVRIGKALKDFITPIPNLFPCKNKLEEFTKNEGINKL